MTTAKGARDENFPVASFFLPAWSRPHVRAFYDFARAADDVADNDLRPDEDKRAVLTAMADQLRCGGEEPYAEVRTLRASLMDTDVPVRHAADLLQAFLWDVDHPRTADWPALMAYCELSAAPVGRYLIDLLGGIEGDHRPSDALCAALQVLNHIQDIKDDLQTLDRVYVPSDWMAEAGVDVNGLAASRSSAAVRGVIDRMLDGVDALLEEAETLPKRLHSRALAREAAGILAIARKLSHMLRARDPLAERVELSKGQMLTHFVSGAMRA